MNHSINSTITTTIIITTIIFILLPICLPFCLLAGLGLTPIGMMSSMVVKLKSKALMTDKAVPEFGYSLPELIALNSK